jgi:hypothetical protein
MRFELQQFQTSLNGCEASIKKLKDTPIADSPPAIPRKKRRKHISVAHKARKARAYGRAWRKLNPTYPKDCKMKWEAYTKLHYTKWDQVPLPKLNPITPTIAKNLQAAIDARPQRILEGPTATRRVPLF